MSDPNKFINTYIDTTIAALHEYVGSSLQLKTQLKLANDLLQEKDGVIASLTNQIEQERSAAIKQDLVDSVSSELTTCRDKLRIAEESHNALKVKVSHMDTLTRQLAEMKNEILSRDDKIATFTNELSTKDAQISSLNQTINELNVSLASKIKDTEKLQKELDKLSEKKQPEIKSVPESSTVKVQLNTKNKTKPKELPIDDDF